MLLRQSSVSLHVVHEVSAVDTLNDKEQPAGGVEGRRGGGEEGRRGGGERRRVVATMSNPYTTPHNYIHTYPLANLIPSLLSTPAPPTHPTPGPSLPHPPAAGLEAGVQSHQEGVVGGLLKDVLLCLNPVNVLFVHHKVFLDHLHRIDAVGLLQLDLGREGRGVEGRG